MENKDKKFIEEVHALAEKYGVDFCCITGSWTSWSNHDTPAVKAAISNYREWRYQYPSYDVNVLK